MFTHQSSRPLHLKGNGLAERAVQTPKKFIRKCKLLGQDVHLALVSFRNMASKNLGPPSQHLYSNCMRTTVPISEELLKLKVISMLQNN